MTSTKIYSKYSNPIRHEITVATDSRGVVISRKTPTDYGYNWDVIPLDMEAAKHLYGVLRKLVK